MDTTSTRRQVGRRLAIAVTALMTAPAALSFAAPSVTAAVGDIETIAGDGTAAFSGDGGPATSAQINRAYGVGVAPNGDVYIHDQLNYRIRKISASTGDISTVLGDGTQGCSGDGGPAASARTMSGVQMAWDSAGDLYYTDTGCNAIRRIDASTGVVTKFAGGGGSLGDGGPATSAQILFPQGIAIDKDDNVYIAEYSGHRIRKVSAATGNISTIAGTGSSGYTGDGGPATSAKLSGPYSVAVDGYANVFFTDSLNNRIRKINVFTGEITTIAGTGVATYGGDGGLATAARLNYPTGLTIDAGGNIFVSDYGSARVRRIDDATGIITTVAGNGVHVHSGDGGPATSGGIPSPIGLDTDKNGNFWVLESLNHRLRKFTMVAASATSTTSSTTSTTTTTTTIAPTTTVAAATTTTAPGGASASAATTTTATPTKSTSTTRTTASAGTIPRTGTDVRVLLTLALGMLAAGAATTLSRRRLRTR